ncbi:MAG: hypothetical protein ACTHL3_01775 [Candidatus Nitrosocosmicus sp.]
MEDRKKTLYPYTKALHTFKNKKSLADERILKISLEKAGLKNIQIEKV